MLDFVVSFVILHLNSTESMTEEQFIKLSQKGEGVNSTSKCKFRELFHKSIDWVK